MPIMSVYKFLLKLIMIQSTSVAESFFFIAANENSTYSVQYNSHISLI